MNAVSGALQSVSNGVGSMMGAPKMNVPPQGNVPPAPPAQTGGRRRGRKASRRGRKATRKNRKMNRKNTRRN